MEPTQGVFGVFQAVLVEFMTPWERQVLMGWIQECHFARSASSTAPLVKLMLAPSLLDYLELTHLPLEKLLTKTNSKPIVVTGKTTTFWTCSYIEQDE